MVIIIINPNVANIYPIITKNVSDFFIFDILLFKLKILTDV
jgi:hypothetical protein